MNTEKDRLPDCEMSQALKRLLHLHDTQVFLNGEDDDAMVAAVLRDARAALSNASRHES